MKNKFQNCFKINERCVLIQQFTLNTTFILHKLKLFFERGNYTCHNDNYGGKMYKNIQFFYSLTNSYTIFVLYFLNKYFWRIN